MTDYYAHGATVPLAAIGPVWACWHGGAGYAPASEPDDVHPGWWLGPAPLMRRWTVTARLRGSSVCGEFPGTRVDAERAALESLLRGRMRESWADDITQGVTLESHAFPYDPATIRTRRATLADLP